MRLPSQRGLGSLPRYGGGWMYQFGHTYLLQQELLNKSNADWFRAIELWHTARHEGLALNISHYTNILQHTLIEEKEGTWRVALDVLRQMKRDAIRADCRTVSMALNILANEARWREALDTFSFFADNNNNNTRSESNQKNKSCSSAGKYSGVGMRMDSVCVAAAVRSCVSANRNSTAEDFVNHLRSETRKSICPVVDSQTINAAIRELSEVVEKEWKDAVENAASLSLTNGNMNNEEILRLENSAFSGAQEKHDDEADEHQRVLVPRTNKNDQTKVVHVVDSHRREKQNPIERNDDEGDNQVVQNQTEEALKRWKNFFERVGQENKRKH